MALPRFPALSAALLTLALAGPVALAAEDAAQSTRAYVETSYLIAPKRIGEFTLVQTRFDPDNKYAGPGFRYQAESHPDFRVDVYVYPAGRMGQAEAMSTGMEAFRSQLDQAVAAEMYSDLVVQEAPFAFAQESTLQSTPEPDPDDPFAASIIAANLASSHPEGRKLSMTLQLKPEDAPAYSAGYLMYRQLYYFKLRASALQSQIDAEQFHAFADRAALTLLPAIEAAHVGDCANATLTVDPGAPSGEVLQALITQSSEQLGYNCHQSAEAAGISGKSAEANLVTIHYEPHEWRAQ